MSTATPYYDRSHPFWDFVADLNEQGPAHPFFARRGGARRGEAANRGSEEQRPGPWGRMRAHQMRTPGPHARPHRHTRFAAQEQEMRDVNSDSETTLKATPPRTRSSTDVGMEAAQSGDEGYRRGPGGRRGGGMGGRGHGRGVGRGRGGRGGMGGRFAHRGPAEVHSDGENMPSADEFHPGPGMRRGGRFAGRGRGVGGPRARAMSAGPSHAVKVITSDGENQPSGDEKSHGPAARRAARLAGRGRGVGGPRARVSREVLFDATAQGQSDGENGTSGDEVQSEPAARRGPGMGGRGRGHAHGAGMGRGRGGSMGLGRGGKFTRDSETAGPGPRGLHGPHGQRRNGSMHAENGTGRHADGKFRPEVDVFDHPEAFVVHVSIAGAKKGDVEVNWNAERSALAITGTASRPGDEEVHKTISTSERKVGGFKRMVRLGNKANPPQVDVDGITANIEDGVLKIEVPKMESGYVEIKKVEIA